MPPREPPQQPPKADKDPKFLLRPPLTMRHEEVDAVAEAVEETNKAEEDSKGAVEKETAAAGNQTTTTS